MFSARAGKQGQALAGFSWPGGGSREAGVEGGTACKLRLGPRDFNTAGELGC